jgi:hypothetical protein
MNRSSPAAVVAFLLAVAVGPSASPAAEPPANTWTRADAVIDGRRWEVPVGYDPAAKRFLVLGGRSTLAESPPSCTISGSSRTPNCGTRGPPAAREPRECHPAGPLTPVAGSNNKLADGGAAMELPPISTDTTAARLMSLSGATPDISANLGAMAQWAASTIGGWRLEQEWDPARRGWKELSGVPGSRRPRRIRAAGAAIASSRSVIVVLAGVPQ